MLAYPVLVLLSATKMARASAPGTSSVTRSAWRDVPLGADDPILGLNQAFAADPSADKVSLGVGAYRDADGKPMVLRAVRSAEERIMASNANKEYAPIAGLPDFVRMAVALMLGEDSPPLLEGRVAAVQTLSGTGACRVAAELLARFPSGDEGVDQLGARTMFVPDPTWSNHWNIFGDAGLAVRSYRYWHPATLGLDLDGMLEDLRQAPCGSAVLLHACAHNPTGVDPTLAQWEQIAAVCEERGLRVLFDSAYQGFASGDPEKDAAAVRMFVERGHPILLAQSFAKNFGLYGERVGALSVLTASPLEAKRVESQLKLVIRPMYSSPPLHGARIVATVLGDQLLKSTWLSECAAMADRIQAMRSALRAELELMRPSRSWAHMTQQIGMFCFSGLTAAQVDRLREEHHLYLTRDGRISMAGVNLGNLKRIAAAIHAVTASEAQ